MPAPSQLAIATAAVTRLLKEEASYHKELAEQEQQIAKLEQEIKNAGSRENDDGNAEFMLKQNVRETVYTSLIVEFPYLFEETLCANESEGLGILENRSGADKSCPRPAKRTNRCCCGQAGGSDRWGRGSSRWCVGRAREREESPGRGQEVLICREENRARCVKTRRIASKKKLHSYDPRASFN